MDDLFVKGNEPLLDGHTATDIGNAERFVKVAAGRAHYVEAWKCWIVYDAAAGVWVRDLTQARVIGIAKEVPVRILSNNADVLAKAAETYTDAEALAKAYVDLGKWAKASSSTTRLESMVKAARDLPGVFISHEAIDAKPHLLNVRNGTVNLITGELQPHDPADLLMLQAPVTYDADARSDLWEACLRTWQPQAETRAYLQRIAGTGISGDAMEYLYVNVGNGQKGKSKFFEAVGNVLGPFRVEPHKRLLTVNRTDGHATEVATLKGARMAIASETADNERLNEASVKKLTGGDRLTARGMYENEWSFAPTHSLFLHTNYQPDIKGTDEGIWRRIRVIPWRGTITHKDERLGEKLAEEHVKSAILNWLIEGYRSYRDLGDAMPPEVEQATAIYRNSEDVLGQFIAQRITTCRGSTLNRELTMAVQTFCHERGDEAPSAAEVTKRMLAAGWRNKRTNAGMVWVGMCLHEPEDETPDQGTDGVGRVGTFKLPLGEREPHVSYEMPTRPTRLDDLQGFLAEPTQAELDAYWAEAGE